MTTVIYRNGKLYADSRVTYHRNENGERVLDHVADDLTKIIEPTNLTVGDKKIHALAFAGDINLIKFAQEMDKVAQGFNEQVSIIDPSYYGPMLPHLNYDSQVLAVTTDAVYLISVTKDGITVSSTSPKGWFVFGTGVHTPNLTETVLKLNAEVAMADIMAHDHNTGGLVQYWRYGNKGVSLLDLSHKTSKFDRFMMRRLRRVRDYIDATHVNQCMMSVYRATHSA